jgi:hypothetical protein
MLMATGLYVPASYIYHCEDLVSASKRWSATTGYKLSKSQDLETRPMIAAPKHRIISPRNQHDLDKQIMQSSTTQKEPKVECVAQLTKGIRQRVGPGLLIG